MTENPRSLPDPSTFHCEAKIKIKTEKAVTGNHIASGSMECHTVFCKDQVNIPICSFGATALEAGLKAEFTLRNIVKEACPTWRVLKDNGLVPQDEQLPDDRMPPYSE